MATIEKTYAPLEKALIDSFENQRETLSDKANADINVIRNEAFKYFRDSGLPTNKDEKWRNSLLTKDYNENYHLDIGSTPYEKSVSEIFECEIHGYHAQVVSMLNGRYYDKQPNALQKLENGVIIGSILVAQREMPELFDKHFGKIANHKQNGFFGN